MEGDALEYYNSEGGQFTDRRSCLSESYLPLFRLPDSMEIKEQAFNHDSVITSGLPLRSIKEDCTPHKLSYILRESQTSRESAHESIDDAISIQEKTFI